MQVSLTNLDEIADEARRLLDSTFLMQLAGDAETDGLPEHAASQKALKAHPLGQSWNQFAKDVERSKKEGKLTLAESSLYLLDLLDALLVTEQLPGFERILRSLKHPTTHFSAAYEARILSQYVQVGAQIEIVKESKERTCDFRVKLDDGSFVGIECKSLQDNSFHDSTLWSSSLRKLRGLLMKYQRNWRLRLFARRYVDTQLLDKVVLAVAQAAKDDRLGYWTLVDGIDVEVRQLSPVGKVFSGGFQVNSDAEIIDIVANVRFDSGKASHADPKVVEIHPYEPDDQTNSILNALSKAAGQLHPETPNIVYIQIPHKKGHRFQKVLDAAWREVLDKLSRDHKRVNLAVLTGQLPTKMLRPEDQPIVWFHAVIPNPQDRNPLPNEFAPAGTHDLGMDLDDKVGTVVLEFDLYSPWSTQLGRSVIYHCSKNGKYQIRIWHSLTGKCRVDVVTPSLGWLSTEGAPHFLDRPTHKLAAAYSTEGVTAYVDGTQIK